MENTKQPFLLVCALGLAGVGLLYAWDPAWFANKFLNLGMAFSLGKGPVDLRHIFRAIGGLYVGISYFWMRSALSGEGLDKAMISVCSICAFTAVGRLASVVLDGMPSNFLVVSLVLEAVLFLTALVVAK